VTQGPHLLLCLLWQKTRRDLIWDVHGRLQPVYSFQSEYSSLQRERIFLVHREQMARNSNCSTSTDRNSEYINRHTITRQ
jgi:hypothetical protein